jgi:large subunit ribosomal protein L18
MSVNRFEQRARRARRTRAVIARGTRVRLTVHRSARHIYAQIFTPRGERVLVQASTLDKELRPEVGGTNKTAAASAVGRALAARALAQGITAVAFDRSGFRYHGRVRALAEAAREAGLEF